MNPWQTEALAEMAKRVIGRARSSGLTIVTAESCTAGALASLLAAAPGAGGVLHGGFVSYSKDFKVASLGVPAELIASQSAVSADVAVAMARCTLERSPGAHLAVAITGVLGPEPDEDGNPVGLLHIAAVHEGRVASERRSGEKEPTAVLRQALACALSLLEDVIATSAASSAEGEAGQKLS